MKLHTFISLGLILLFSANSLIFAETGNNDFQTNQDSFDGLDHARMNSINAESAMLDNLADNKNKTGRAEPKPQAKGHDKDDAPLSNNRDDDSTGRVPTHIEKSNADKKGKRKNNPKPKKPNNTPNTVSVKNNKGSESSYFAKKSVVITQKMLAVIGRLASEYKRLSGEKLIINSASRTPFSQANAMVGRIDKLGERGVQRLYKNKQAVNEILDAYRKHRNYRPAAVKEMSKVIEKQISNGVYISRHLRANAIDVSSSSNPKALKKAVAKVGGNYFFERDHFHVNLP